MGHFHLPLSGLIGNNYLNHKQNLIKGQKTPMRMYRGDFNWICITVKCGRSHKHVLFQLISRCAHSLHMQHNTGSLYTA